MARGGDFWFRVLLVIALAVLRSAAQTPSAAQTSGPASQGKPSSNAPEAPAQPSSSSSTESSASNPSNEDLERENSLGKLYIKHILEDQRAIWTSPLRIREEQAYWLVPLAGVTAGMLATDKDVSGHLNDTPSTIKHYKDISNYGAYSLVGINGGLFVLGHMTDDPHERETGLLAGEAAINSLAFTEAVKYATGRERPYQDHGLGQFWQGGVSFPSEHAAIAWSTAGILAHEYPGIFTKLFAYGLAATVSSTRVLGKQHFPSDALVGSAVGYLTSEYVYREHHDPSLGGGEWSFPPLTSENKSWKPSDMGSPYVPLDSWIYPAMDRLIGMGFLQSAIQDIKPWTRMECARLLEDSREDLTAEVGLPKGAKETYEQLADEFSNEMGQLEGGKNQHARLETIYTRTTEIVGPPLTDGYHFGQTIIDNYGRPYERGFNNDTGFSAWATDGPFVTYVQAEYQHAPTGVALPLAARQAISNADFRPIIPPGQGPVQPDITPPAVNQMDLLQAYVGMAWHDLQFTFGKQSFWWGPGDPGAQQAPILGSDNAEPVNMFRISLTKPVKLPSILGVLGSIRSEFFLGQIDGTHFIYGVPTGLIGTYTTYVNPQPFIHGQKVTFKPTQNLEFSVAKTTLYGGPGKPLTATSFFKSVFEKGNGLPGTPQDLGDRRSSFDLTYRLPGIRDWATFYCDGFTEDQYSPVAYWDRSAWRSGLYFSRLPGLPKMDLYVEGEFTDLPAGGALGYGFFYGNSRYLEGYTNNGVLMGSWIGRQGQGAQTSTDYWFSPRSRLEGFYRHQKVSQQFIKYGGTLTDGGLRQDFWLKSSLSVGWQVQYEDWIFPVIATGQQTNWASSIQLTLWAPKWGRK